MSGIFFNLQHRNSTPFCVYKITPENLVLLIFCLFVLNHSVYLSVGIKVERKRNLKFPWLCLVRTSILEIGPAANNKSEVATA